MTQKFAQPEVKEVVVGLSDEHLHSLYNFLNGSELPFNCAYHKWSKTQTFTQPNESLIADNLALAKELEELKAHRFQPNWDNAPADAVEYSVFEYYTTKAGHTCRSGTLALVERPTPPAPKVEAGQTWKYKGMHYTVGLLSKFKVDSEWVDSVNYISDDSGDCYTRTVEDFLAKFERVQP
jgi:hypothetical protein